jgi:hypothetical protein
MVYSDLVDLLIISEIIINLTVAIKNMASSKKNKKLN